MQRIINLAILQANSLLLVETNEGWGFLGGIVPEHEEQEWKYIREIYDKKLPYLKVAVGSFSFTTTSGDRTKEIVTYYALAAGSLVPAFESGVAAAAFVPNGQINLKGLSMDDRAIVEKLRDGSYLL
jgi:hypothetical protein